MVSLIIPTDAKAIAGPAQGHWTYADWERLPDDGDRYEVIDGVLYMTTAPSTFHEWITIAFMRYVGIPAIEQGLAYVMTAPVGVLMPGCDPVQPDVVVVLKEHASLFKDRRIRGVPDLIVEILSPSNADYDLRIKLAAYARAGLPEFAIIDPVERTLSLRRLAEPGRYAPAVIAGGADVVVFDCLPSISLAVADLFAGAPDETN